MATARPNFFCHKCRQHIGHVSDFECPNCRDGFIEEVPAQQQHQHQSSRSRIGHLRGGGTGFQVHGTMPMGHTTIVFRGQGPNDGMDQHHGNGVVDLGTFFQTVLAQLTGGLTGGSQQIPFFMHNGGAAGFLDPANLDAFLTQLLNQTENGGPAPAPENRINSIPTVKVTTEQARDNLQCAICMDDFKEGDQAKRLPCSHHFHEECISRWLRLHGTCPTCRVTLDGDNTTNREYFNVQPNQQQEQTRTSQQSSSSNNRRNETGTGGGPASSGGGSGGGFSLFDFD